MSARVIEAKDVSVLKIRWTVRWRPGVEGIARERPWQEADEGSEAPSATRVVFSLGRACSSATRRPTPRTPSRGLLGAGIGAHSGGSDVAEAQNTALLGNEHGTAVVGVSGPRGRAWERRSLSCNLLLLAAFLLAVRGESPRLPRERISRV
jgi:hypothetical protein